MKLKETSKQLVVGYNNSSQPLGERNDLHILAEIGLKSNNPNILNLFEELPTLEEFQNEKAKNTVEKVKETLKETK